MGIKDFTADYLAQVANGQRNALHFTPSEAQEELTQRGLDQAEFDIDEQIAFNERQILYGDE